MNHTEQGTIAVGAPGSAMRRITEHPEPTATAQFLRYTVSTHTPWGTAQSATTYGEGLICYTTAGHGGFHVSAKLLKRMPEYLQTADKYANGRAGWFEEDCGWAIVAITYPERFTMETRMAAVQTMQNTYPEAWAKFCEVQS